LGQMTRLEEQTLRRQANAGILDEALSGSSAVRMLRTDPRITRRSYHLYIFRVNEAALGISRDRFLEALQAEGVPASKGWYRPLYGNQVFQNAHIGPAHGIKSPLARKGVDYRQTHCPVCEQVCKDAVWLPQTLLLAPEPDIEAAAAAILKVIQHAGQLRG